MPREIMGVKLHDDVDKYGPCMPSENIALQSVGATTGVYSCGSCGAVWLHIEYPNLCPVCSSPCLTQSWVEMHDQQDKWYGMDNWEYPILVRGPYVDIEC